MVFANDMTYNGIALSSINADYVIAGFDDGSDPELISRSVLRSDISYDQPITYDYGAVDTNVFSFDIIIMKRSGGALSKSEIRTLLGELISPTSPQWLTFTGCENEVYNGLFFKGRFTKVSYEGFSGSKKIAIGLTFENISPYAYTREYTYEFPTANDTMSDTITNLGTYVGKTIIPKITITATAAGTVTVQNTSDTSQDAFSLDLLSGETVVIEDFNCFYEGGTLFPFSRLNNFNWPVLKDGDNGIVFTGDCTAEIKVRYYEAVGV